MATAIQVGAFIETLVPSNEWKLQKLVYLAQAWSLGWKNRPLFDETVEAWRDGPVVRSLYARYRHGPAPKYDGTLSVDERHVIESVVEFYGSLTSGELINLTHEDQPWIDARRGVAPHVYTQWPIDLRAVAKLYARRSALGIRGPVMRGSVEVISDEDARTGASRVIGRWKSALDLLATR